MLSRRSPFAVLLLVSGSLLSNAQTATCTNWKFFNLSSPAGLSTIPLGINRWGTVVGYGQSSDASTAVGFIRYANGAFKTYAAPNASRTYLTRRNALGVTVGWYAASANQNARGLVLSGSNTATVNYPGANESILLGINYWHTMVGIFTFGDFSLPYDGFKLKNGVFTTLHYPGSVTTNPSSISDKGVIAGWYQNSGYHKYHGFTLANGIYKTLDHPKAVYGTFLNDINGSGVIPGIYVDGSSQGHPFIYINGSFKDVHGPNIQVLSVDGINGYGYVTGTASNATGSTAFTAHCQ